MRLRQSGGRLLRGGSFLWLRAELRLARRVAVAVIGATLGWDKCWPFCCCCKLGDPCTLEKYLTPCCNDVTYGGFFEMGYHSQNTGLSANDGDELDTNDYPGRVQLQQAYFQVGKKAKTDSCCCDWGYQMDAVYGTNGWVRAILRQPEQRLG